MLPRRGQKYTFSLGFASGAQIYVCMYIYIQILVGGFNPSEKYESDWIIIPAIGENKKCSKPPTSIIIYTNIFLRDSPFLVDGPEHHQLQESSTAPGVVWMPPAQHCAIRAQGRESHLRRGQENHLTGPAVVMATG